MEAIETFELPAENAIPITEKRCYTVEDLQIILGISRGRNFAGLRSDPPIEFQRRASMSGWTTSCKLSRMSSRSATS